MDEHDRVSPLSYASRQPSTPRLSRLAVISPIAAVLGCPYLTFPAYHWVINHAPSSVALRETWGIGLMLIWTAATTAIPVVALIRVRRSGGTLIGLEAAKCSLLASLVWWVMIIPLLIFLYIRPMGWAAPAG